jgi:hypothetical protein
MHISCLQVFIKNVLQSLRCLKFFQTGIAIGASVTNYAQPNIQRNQPRKQKIIHRRSIKLIKN